MVWLEIMVYGGIAVAVASVIWATLSLAPWVPARRRDLERISRLADLRPGEVWYEFGAGDGRVSSYMARTHPHSRIVGLELSWPLYAVCRLRRFVRCRRNATFLWRNAFTAAVGEADVVYMFGMPKTVAGAMQEKLQRELKPGARVISYTFAMRGWQPERVDKPEEKDIAIYRYVMPRN